MDEQTQSFLELTAKDDLVQLVGDKRAAWLWSADGARILWANTAGAAFFAAHTVSDLASLSSLERSPARPHIARIAESGSTEKFSIDRLRFYRGLRVMLLTCQCKRLVLDTGEAAALIVCGDKGLAATKDPVAGFAHMLAADGATVFVTSGGETEQRIGALAGQPEDLDLPAGQNVLFGPIELDGAYHDGVLVDLSEKRKLIVLDDIALADDEADTEVAGDGTLAAGAAALAAGAASGAVSDVDTLADNIPPADSAEDDAAAWVRADEDELETETGEDGELDLTAATGSTEEDEQPLAEDSAAAPAVEDTVSDATASDDPAAEPEVDTRSEDLQEPAGDGEPAPSLVDDTDTDTDTEMVAKPEPVAEDDPAEDTSGSDADKGFVFQPRRRPVRFAWKMDVDQRFTFLSDEFAEVLGPVATDIVGLTWDEVSDRFDLDPRGQIARALDRRDTWSGKTVDWPVSGASLRVPVDMAALPAFDRNRKFEGYRGFGVCRTADALRDPSNSLRAAGAAVAASALVASSADAEEAEADDEDVKVEETGTVPAGLAEPDTASTEAEDITAAPFEDDAQTADDETSEAAGPDADDAVPDDAPETPAAATSSVEDLKPAQPDSFAGKTFLGASAAALVGSLARFTGKSAPKTQEPSRPVETPVAAESVPTAGETGAEDKTAATPEAPAEETTADTARENDDDLPGAALDSRLQALQTGQTFDPVESDDEAEDTEDAAAEASDTEAPEADTDDVQEVGSLADADDATDEPAEETEPDTSLEAEEADPSDEQPETMEADKDGEDAADEDEDAKPDPVTGDARDEVLADDPEVEAAAEETDDAEPVPVSEPVGISGPAALKPAEIESAVKSLAKTYKANEKKPRDLFEAVAGDEADTGAEAVAADEEDRPETAQTEDTGTGEEDGVPDVAEDMPEPSMEDAHFDIVDEDARAIEATAADLEDADRTEGSDAEEREFFEETAAFETEDQAAADAEDDDAPEPPRTGEVIPLATARPRVVPVDTSGLSRPERQAFRKIAEALGARLEGDLAEWDAPDPEEPAEEELPPDLPEAGPIDPSLLDRLPIGIAIVHDREVLYANKALLAMIGYKSIGKLSQVGGLEALFIDDAEELPDAAGMDGEVDEAMKLRLADGGVLNVDAHMHSVPWNGSQGLMISITERKPKTAPAGEAAPTSPNFFAEVRSELESARNQIAEMDTILETATDGVLVLDQHGTILKVNGSAEALFSANRADMIGAPFTDILAPESHRAAADYLDGLSRNGVASILNDGREVLGKVPTGGLIPLFMTMGRISGSQDDAKYCAVLRDITQWKTAEEELTQAKRQAENASSAKSDFLAKISHEIRTPLNAIIGFSEVMMEERFGPIGNDRYKDYLKDIRTSGSHIMSLVNDLLDLSKIEAGKLDLKFSAVSTSDVINECVALMQPQANRERVIIRASLPDSVPDVVADPRSLRQIVLNLLSNAIKYNRSGGQVILSTALESNGEVALRVRDTGTGMTAKQLAAALEPFRQLHTSSRGGGTGLGLPLTKALVEANRASFHIDSTPDQGTLVEILFPTQRVLSE